MGEEGGQSPGTKQGKANQSTGGLAWGWGVGMHAQSLSRVRPCVTLWAAARRAPLSMGFSRQEYWTGLSCPLPGDLPHPGTEPVSLTPLRWQAGSLPQVPPGKPQLS